MLQIYIYIFEEELVEEKWWKAPQFPMGASLYTAYFTLATRDLGRVAIEKGVLDHSILWMRKRLQARET